MAHLKLDLSIIPSYKKKFIFFVYLILYCFFCFYSYLAYSKDRALYPVTVLVRVLENLFIGFRQRGYMPVDSAEDSIFVRGRPHFFDVRKLIQIILGHLLISRANCPYVMFGIVLGQVAIVHVSHVSGLNFLRFIVTAPNFTVLTESECDVNFVFRTGLNNGL